MERGTDSMIITDFNKMTLEELQVMNTVLGITFVISDGKIEKEN